MKIIIIQLLFVNHNVSNVFTELIINISTQKFLKVEAKNNRLIADEMKRFATDSPDKAIEDQR